MKTRAKSLRADAKKWTCNQLAITNHQGEAASLLRKMADTLDKLGAISILDLTYARSKPPSQEITMSLYYSFLSEANRPMATKTMLASRSTRRTFKTRTLASRDRRTSPR